MPTAADLSLDEVIAAANTILTDTPDNEWWHLHPDAVVELAFPDWDIVECIENTNYNRPEHSCPRVLLRHTSEEDRWLLMWSTGRELLPGRMSTMGQYYRFDPKRSRFALGTASDLCDTAARNTPHDRSVLWWLFDVFDRLNVDTGIVDPTSMQGTAQALHAVVQGAETRLRASYTLSTPHKPRTRRDILTVAFPDWEIAGMFENPTTPRTLQTRALLRHISHPNQWLLMTSWEHTLFGYHPTGGRSLRADESRRPHTQYRLDTIENLIASTREARAPFDNPTARVALSWLLWQASRGHPDPATATAYREEVEATVTLLALSDTPVDDPAYTLLREMMSPLAGGGQGR